MSEANNFLDYRTLLDVFEAACGFQPVVIDEAKILGALGGPQASFGGKYLHHGLYSKAAVLLRDIVMAHGFIDGNKRCAWSACIAFLKVNGENIHADQDEAAQFVLRIVIEHLGITEIADQLAAWATSAM